MHQWHVISLLIHGFLSVNARLLIAFGTAFYAIIHLNCCVGSDLENHWQAVLTLIGMLLVLWVDALCSDSFVHTFIIAMVLLPYSGDQIQ